MRIIEHTFTDKNRDFRTYHTIRDNDNNTYSKILFHKIKWHLSNSNDFFELQDIWAETIIQSIIDGYTDGDFEVMCYLENDEEEYHWLHWQIMTVWDGWS